MNQSLIWISVLLVAILTSGFCFAQSTRQYDVYKMEHKIESENIRTEVQNRDSVTYIDIAANDRGTALKLSARVSLDNGRTRYVSKGHTSRFKTENIDTTFSQQDGYFLSENGSVFMRELLVRQWLKNEKRQSTRSTFDRKPMMITLVGEEKNPLNVGKLSVYKIGLGVDEILWLDENNNAVYLGYCDTESDKREVIETKYKQYLSEFTQKSNGYLLRAILQNDAVNAKHFSSVAIVGGNLIDVVNDGMISPNSLVILQDGKIQYAGKYDKAVIPAGARLIDATGKYLIPGLWNMHVHLSHPEQLKKELLTGVTSVRDMGNEFDFATAIMQKTNITESPFPKVYSAGLIDGRSENSLGAVVAGNENEAKSIVKRYHDAGFSQIKVYSYIRKNTFRAIVEEANKYDMEVVGHLPIGYTLSYFIDNGMSSVSHVHYFMNSLKWGGSLKEDNKVLLDKLIANKVYIDPTLNVYHLTGDVKLPQYRRIVKVLSDYGIPVVAGTDNEGSVADELQNYVMAGLSPIQAIRSATIVPAKMMREDAHTGSIERGKNADILILDANPMTDMSSLKQIGLIIKGEWIIAPNALE